MTSEARITVENVSKRYWLFRRYRERLQQLLLAPVTRKEYGEPFWALNDVSFSVNPGEVFGVIGVNGSGKSTLLQIIAGILQPTKGRVDVNGRMTAILELGAGFHREFTGHENVYLTGAILGIKNKEMKERYDQIVDFAGIGEFIDQPVKLYSSGMYVRLAFAIATCVDPDVLVVDEALAVGDAGFVIKCMDRMAELKRRGTAILYVTHDVQAVRSFCDKVIWLNQGNMEGYGLPGEVTSKYVQYLWTKGKSPLAADRKAEGTGEPEKRLVRWGSGKLRVESYSISSDDELTNYFEYGRPLRVEVVIRAEEDATAEDAGVGVCFRNQNGLDVITLTTFDAGVRFPALKAGRAIRIVYSLENILAPGDYALVLNVENRAGSVPMYYDFIENAQIMKVVSETSVFSMVLPKVAPEITLLDDIE